MPFKSSTISDWIGIYFKRWLGGVPGSKPVPPVGWIFLLISFIGAFSGMMCCAGLEYSMYVNYGANSEQRQYTYLPGSFGAMAILVYGVPRGPLSQPRNVYGGQILSVIIGVGCRKLFTDHLGVPYIAQALGVSLTLTAMQIVRVTHPPAGGTALIASAGSPLVNELGWRLIVPVMLASTMLLVVALIVNNVSSQVSYPGYWLLGNPDAPKLKVEEEQVETGNDVSTSQEMTLDSGDKMTNGLRTV